MLAEEEARIAEALSRKLESRRSRALSFSWHAPPMPMASIVQTPLTVGSIFNGRLDFRAIGREQRQNCDETDR